MKTRSGFVSNSSSSSFVIAYKPEHCDECGMPKNKVHAFLEMLAEVCGYGGDESLGCAIYKDKESYQDNLGDDEEDEALGYIEKGYVVASITMPYGTELDTDSLAKRAKAVVLSEG